MQSDATWGLDRIDQRRLAAAPLDHTYSYTRTGAGVTAYVIDTGVLTGHSEFGGRASVGTDTVGDGRLGQDCNGHGTHVAGTIGSSTYGVAKQVSVVAVRVLGCDGSGSTSGVLQGIQWVIDHHVGGAPAVANLSLGGPQSSALDTAVSNAIADGVVVAVAAGNGNQAGVPQDACKTSPARVPAALTVGATDRTDRATPWSNYGRCIDLFAPGMSITSAWIPSGAGTSTTETNTISGTSMATPHVAGVAALFLEATPQATPAAVAGALRANATQGVVTGTRTAENDVLYSGFITGPVA